MHLLISLIYNNIKKVFCFSILKYAKKNCFANFVNKYFSSRLGFLYNKKVYIKYKILV